MTVMRDAHYALAVLVGKIDRCDPTIPARLAIARVLHFGQDDLRGLFDRAMSAHAVALGQDLDAADRAYLRAVAAGGVNFLDDDVFARMAPIYARRRNDPELLSLFALGAEAFADAAMDAAANALHGGGAAAAIRTARTTSGRATGKGGMAAGE